ncbi:hypothetical protein L7F22_062314 [Adiantum nelumboides]|nr:hypothetical protein [Adiantum nelumboides]
MRQLKHHEQKLLKKHDFLNWKQDQSHREIKVMRRYHIQHRTTTKNTTGSLATCTTSPSVFSRLPPTDPFRLKRESALLSKAYDIGLVDTGAKMSVILDKVNVSAFARRRLGVVMVRLKMSQSVKQAVTYIEQGQIRVGPDTITDPAFLVTRNMEDFVSWVDQSKIRQHIARYTGEHDDYDLL